MIKSFVIVGSLLLAMSTTQPPAFAGPIGGVSVEASAYQQDRASILAMAGNYKVRFDFRETTAFVDGYVPIPAKVSGGYESVRVIEEGPDRISLQHILVVEDNGKSAVVKHWRQDWEYQPREVLTYQGPDKWVLTPVLGTDRRGAWSQTVWQTDDSPRYGAIGRWTYDAGVSRWMSGTTLRPLARRDAVRHPVYNWYVGTNRHALTPAGWVQEQDNAKVGLKDGRTVTFVHEVVTNTYTRNDAFPVAVADAYWAATHGYWSAVRKAWDAEITAGRGIRVVEEAENGSATGPKLMAWADDIQVGKITEAAAIVQAKVLISGK